ncbi:MAG TPA: fibronectin type III domain-containing protein, partial [Chitinophagaceae bacterium]|nr:fibronectin type III domain-containing protein [Chitinophagaceae bacterium]
QIAGFYICSEPKPTYPMITKSMPSVRHLFLFSLFITLITSCTKEQNENNAPGNFTVTVSSATSNSALLNWTAAKDPENETVTYAVELNGNSVATNITATNHILQNLVINTNYTGKITASDASGHKNSIAFSFTTSDAPVPSDFTVKLDASTNKNIAFSWTPSTLPGNEPVTYDVYADNQLKATGLTQTAYVVAQLTPKTTYKLKVVAKAQSGKSFEKLLDVQTMDNSSPAAFSVEEVEHGFSFIKIKWNAPTEADNDSLSFFLNKNGVITPITYAPDNNGFIFVAKGLGAASTYSISIIAKDPYGAETSSNALSITTKNGPENNFAFESRTDGSHVVVEWNQSYPFQFNTANSSYYINGVQKSLANVQVNFLDMGNGVLNCKAYLNASDFPANNSQPVKFQLNWGANETVTQSRVINYTRYVFSATTADVNYAIIKRYSNGDYGFVLKFANDVISDYNEWTVKEVKFENAVSPGSISLQFASGKTVQSVFGNLSATDFDYLKTRADGYIIIQDEGGYHRINFTYSVL